VAGCDADELPPALPGVDCSPFAAACLPRWCAAPREARPLRALADAVFARLAGPDAAPRAADARAPPDDVECARVQVLPRPAPPSPYPFPFRPLLL